MKSASNRPVSKPNRSRPIAAFLREFLRLIMKTDNRRDLLAIVHMSAWGKIADVEKLKVEMNKLSHSELFVYAMILRDLPGLIKEQQLKLKRCIGTRNERRYFREIARSGTAVIRILNARLREFGTEDAFRRPPEDRDACPESLAYLEREAHNCPPLPVDVPPAETPDPLARGVSLLKKGLHLVQENGAGHLTAPLADAIINFLAELRRIQGPPAPDKKI